MLIFHTATSVSNEDYSKTKFHHDSLQNHVLKYLLSIDSKVVYVKVKLSQKTQT